MEISIVLAVGMVVMMFLFFTALAIISFVISSKKKETNPGDSKTWKTIGIILVVIDVLVAAGTAFAVIVPAMLSA